MKIEMESIGTIETEFTEIEGMPIQPTGAKGFRDAVAIPCSVILDAHIILRMDHFFSPLYHKHFNKKTPLPCGKRGMICRIRKIAFFT